MIKVDRGDCISLSTEGTTGIGQGDGAECAQGEDWQGTHSLCHCAVDDKVCVRAEWMLMVMIKIHENNHYDNRRQ